MWFGLFVCFSTYFIICVLFHHYSTFPLAPLHILFLSFLISFLFLFPSLPLFYLIIKTLTLIILKLLVYDVSILISFLSNLIGGIVDISIHFVLYRSIWDMIKLLFY
jgi:hypothetical protein